MKTKDYDWSKFSVRINIKAPLQKIFNSWTTQKNLEKWFLRLAEFTKPDGTLRKRNSHIQKGDTYRWRWHGYNDQVTEYGKILKINGKDLLRFTFAGNCVVTVSVKKVIGENILELKQENIPTNNKSKVDFHLGCQTGWLFYMTNLKSILEGGIDLRNKNMNLEKVLNA